MPVGNEQIEQIELTVGKGCQNLCQIYSDNIGYKYTNKCIAEKTVE